MSGATFYRGIDIDRLCQGDIFEHAPNVFLKDRPNEPQGFSLAGVKAGTFLHQLHDSSFPQGGTTVIIPGPVLVERAILLSHGCEIDKDHNHCTIALVRSINRALTEEEREHIRSGRKKAFFHLPAVENIQEGYIVFRRISTVGSKWLEKGKRVTCLSESLKRKMLLAMFTFFSRLELEVGVFGPEEPE